MEQPKQTVNKKEIVKKLLKQEINIEDEEDLIEMLIDRPIAFDVDKQEDKTLKFGDKAADKISEIAGSWTFIIVFSLFLISWVVLNTIIMTSDTAIDPYPFILLNLLLSTIAALQAPVIMMSQNRQAKKDSLRNQNDYQVDLKSELILEKLHDEIGEVLKNQRAIFRILEKEEEQKEETKMKISTIKETNKKEDK